MSRKRHLYGAAAAALVAGFLLSGSVAFAQQPGVGVTWEQARDKALGTVPGTVVGMEWDEPRMGVGLAYEVEWS
jgi:hypothetical protein